MSLGLGGVMFAPPGGSGIGVAQGGAGGAQAAVDRGGGGVGHLGDLVGGVAGLSEAQVDLVARGRAATGRGGGVVGCGGAQGGAALGDAAVDRGAGAVGEVGDLVVGVAGGLEDEVALFAGLEVGQGGAAVVVGQALGGQVGGVG